MTTNATTGVAMAKGRSVLCGAIQCRKELCVLPMGNFAPANGETVGTKWRARVTFLQNSEVVSKFLMWTVLALGNPGQSAA